MRMGGCQFRFLRELALAGSLVACNVEGEDGGPEDSDGVAQELTLAEPLAGMYHWDAPNGPLLADAAASWLGRSQDVALAFAGYDNWSQITLQSWQLQPWSNWVKARPGRTLVFAIPLLPGPTNGAGPDGSAGTSDDVSLQKCSDGQYDQYWKAMANNLVTYGLGSTIMRLGWEFDGDWYAWSARGRESQFAGCFRRVVTAVRQAQPNAGFKFDWNPTEDISQWSSAQVEAAWPGDDYVDYIGVDAYDSSWASNSYPYPSSCDSACRTTHQTNAWNDLSRGLYAMRDRAVTHNKLLSIPEWGVWNRPDGHGGGDNPLYISKMYDFVHAAENRVGFQIYFDVNWSDGGHQISDVNGTGSDTSAQHNYATQYPDSAARYKALFGAAPVSAPTPTPTPAPASTPTPTPTSTPTPTPTPAPTPAPTPTPTPAPTPAPASAPSSTTTVTVDNAGFELGRQGWYFYGSATTTSTGQHSGSSALKIGRAMGGAEQDLASRLQVGGKYKLSAYAKAGRSGESASIGMKFLDRAGNILSERYAMINTTSYSLNSFEFTVPAGTVRALAYGFKAAGLNSTATYDDFKVVRLQ